MCVCVCVCSDRQPVTGSCRRSSVVCVCVLTGNLSLGLVGGAVCVCALTSDLSLGLVGRAVCVQLQRYNVFTFICLLIFASLGKVN